MTERHRRTAARSTSRNPCLNHFNPFLLDTAQGRHLNGLKGGRRNRSGGAKTHRRNNRGPTPGGVIARVLQRILALTAAIWHNAHTDQPVLRSLTAYDH